MPTSKKSTRFAMTGAEALAAVLGRRRGTSAAPKTAAPAPKAAAERRPRGSNKPLEQVPSSYPYPCDDPLIGQELPIRICSDVPGSKRRQCGVQMLVPVACSGGDGAPRGYFVAQKGERYIVPAGQVRRALVDQSAVLEQLAEDGRCDVAARLMRSGTEPPSAAFDACPPLDDIAPERVIPDFDPGEIEATARNDAPTKARTVYIPALRAHGTIERWVTDNVAEIRYGQPGGGFTSRMFARREFEAV